MTPADREYLLDVARAAIRATVEGVATPALPDYEWSDPTLRGAFVTIRCGGKLRGCIGTFYPEHSLPATIRDIAAAAVQDPRLDGHPIHLAELERLSIEISVLSPLVRTTEPMSLELGVH